MTESESAKEKSLAKNRDSKDGRRGLRQKSAREPTGTGLIMLAVGAARTRHVAIVV